MLAQELVVLMGTIERPREQHHGGWRYDSGESDEKEELWAHLPGRGRGGGLALSLVVSVTHSPTP